MAPGDTLDVREGHDSGWVAVIGNRMAENAPKALTVCGHGTDECPAGSMWTIVHHGDPVCPPPPGDNQAYKCVKASVVRGRGPLSGRAEVTHASASGSFDDPDTVALAPRPLAANSYGSWVAVHVGAEAMPWINLGGAEALLVIGPGERYQVWLDDQGRVDSARVTAK